MDSLSRYQRGCGALVLGALILSLVLLGGRLAYIQTEHRARLLDRAERQQEGHSLLPAQRGMVLDTRGRVIALSQWQPDVYVDPSRISDEDIGAFAELVSPRINIPADEVVRKIARRPNSRYVVLAHQTDDVTADAVRVLHNPALGLAEHATRINPLGSSMASVLGMVGRDGHGQEGVELALDEHLRGRDGRRPTICDARRRALAQGDEPPVPAVDGGHVVLTIDAEIQRITEAAVGEAIEKFRAESGVAIVMSPKTGEVLALASLPTLDPDGRPQSGERPESGMALRRNRAITDPIEPGSAFKPVIVAGALAGKFISPDEKIDCHQGTFHIGKRTLTDTVPYGVMDLKGIMTRSSNIGMAQIGMRMGNKALHDTMREFGFGDKTGIELPGEAEGRVYPLSKWSGLSATSVCMGYEVHATPLQLVNAFAALINDGVMLRPRIVKALLTAEGNVRASFDEPVPVRRVVAADIARYITHELLVAVVEDGSARVAQVGPYKLLGKTGTAKLPYKDRKGYEPGQYQSTFVGAAPAHDPVLVALVIVRRPDPAVGYYGSKVAAPAVGLILTQSLAYLQVPPDEELAAAR